MLISIILLFLIPLFVVGGSFFMLGDDFFTLFKGGDIFGRLFSDLLHILVLWLVGAVVEIWLIYSVVSQLL